MNTENNDPIADLKTMLLRESVSTAKKAVSINKTIDNLSKSSSERFEIMAAIVGMYCLEEAGSLKENIDFENDINTLHNELGKISKQFIKSQLNDLPPDCVDCLLDIYNSMVDPEDE